ncbi:MAG: site-2 protease family protein [bacterium]|nr:site-2 protease family protein [bacterium]
MSLTILLYELIILMFAIMIHEVSHGTMAYFLGDKTAKEAGRLTFNPAKHFELWGSFVLPLLLFFASAGRLMFGWARPVPFNPLNLKNPKRGTGLIGLAGPASNFLVALIFGIFTRLIVHFQVISLARVIPFFDLIVQINLMLGVFNLVPIPPLDGSKILFSLLPRSAERFILFLEQYGMIFLFAFIFFGFQYLIPIINWLRIWIIGG